MDIINIITTALEMLIMLIFSSIWNLLTFIILIPVIVYGLGAFWRRLIKARWYILQIVIITAVTGYAISNNWFDNPSAGMASLWIGVVCALVITAAASKVIQLWRRHAGRRPQHAELPPAQHLVE